MTVKEKIKFIKNYEQASNASTGSKYDQNANVTVKNIATLAAELPKKDTIDLNRELMQQKLTELYGKEYADQYIDDLAHHIIYKHDETNIAPYTYSPDESIIVSYNNKIILTTFEKLYNIVDVAETSPEEGVWIKVVSNLKVLDRSNNKKPNWTSVLRLVRKTRKRDMYRVSTKHNEVLVTDNHPMIISEDINKTIEAKNCTGNKQYVIDIIVPFKGKEKRYITGNANKSTLTVAVFDKEFGFYLGCLFNYNIEESKKYYIISFNSSEKEEVEKIKNFFETRFNTKTSLLYVKFLNTGKLIIKKNSAIINAFNSFLKIKLGKEIPENIFELSSEFAEGLISGIFDKKNSITLRRGEATKLWSLLNICNKNPEIKRIFNPNYLEISLNAMQNEENVWTDIVSVEKVNISNDKPFIYDITTETGSFICNGIYVHNCVSISMYPFLLHGMKQLSGTSDAPKHADSFCGGFINLLFDVASQFAGACLYKNQRILVRDKDHHSKILTMKNLIDQYQPDIPLPGHDDWYYRNISEFNLEVYDNGQWTRINKVYKRKYKDDIYKLTSTKGRTILCSKDHKIKVKIRNKKADMFIPASKLKVDDLLYSTYENLSITKNDEYRIGQLVGLIEANKMIINDNIYVFIENKYKKVLSFIKSYNLMNVCEIKESSSGITFNVTNIYSELKKFLPYDREEELSAELLFGYLDGVFALNKYKTAYCLKTYNKNIIDTVLKVLTFIGEEAKYGRVASDNNIYRIFFKKKYYNLFDLANTVKMSPNCPIRKDKIKYISKFTNDDDYVYEIETQSHQYSASGYLTHNCATPEFLPYMDHFLRIDYGQDYTSHLDDIIEFKVSGNLTLRQKIENFFQQIVYTCNQPAAARGSQSIFWNIAYYDKPYFESIFNGFYFPDGDEPCYETTKELQKMFIKWFNKERTKEVLTFPVETFNLLYDKDTKRFKDEESADFVADAWAHGHSFFLYTSDSADALSSCCFDYYTPVQIRLSTNLIEKTGYIGDLYNLYANEQIEVLSNGKFKPAKFIKLPARPMYSVNCKNGNDEINIVVSDNHLNPTQRGDIETKDLKVGDSLKYAPNVFDKEFTYLPITSIQSVKSEDEYIYCFEMEDQSYPYFTLPNGIITHNCRLKNAIEENTFSYTLGAGGIQTGSKGVITMNINRIVQDWARSKDNYIDITIGDKKYCLDKNQKIEMINKETNLSEEHTFTELMNNNLLDKYEIEDNVLLKYVVKE